MSSPLVCQACLRPVRIQDASGIDPFTLFGLPVAYSLSRPELEKAYLKLSKSLHPDFYRDRPVDQPAARRLAALANDSYALLKDTLKRTQLLVRLWGGEVVASDKSVAPGFLEEQLALRESAELIKEDDVVREGLRRTAIEKTMLAEKEISDSMSAAEKADDKAALLGEVQRRLNELNYHRRLLRKLEKHDTEE